MAGVKVAEFYVQYMFSNGRQRDMVQKKNNATCYIHGSRKSRAALRAIESNRDTMSVTHAI